MATRNWLLLIGWIFLGGVWLNLIDKSFSFVALGIFIAALIFGLRDWRNA